MIILYAAMLPEKKIYHMPVFSMKVKVLDVSATYVNFKYINSNSKARAFKDAFMKDYDSRNERALRA